MRLTYYANLGWLQKQKDALVEGLMFERITGTKTFTDRTIQLAPPWVRRETKTALREFAQGLEKTWKEEKDSKDART